MSHHILVVEDDHKMRLIVEEMLEDEDYSVQGAAHVEDALKLATKTKFDLLVTDVRMPGENGIEGFVKLKQHLPALKCIVMTGYNDYPTKTLAVQVGVSEYIYKPFSFNEMSKAVDRVIHDKKWALFYSNIIQKGPFRVMAGIFQALKRDHVSEVNEARGKVFESLYVAIRSDKDTGSGNSEDNVLPRYTAKGLYYQLDLVDNDYEAYLSEPTDEAANRLLQIYQGLLEKFSTYVRNKATIIDPGELDAAQFSRLYSAIQKGEITAREFFLAPALRAADSRTLKDSPELLELHQKMWGQA